MANFASCNLYAECSRAQSEERIECDALDGIACPAGRSVGGGCGLHFDGETVTEKPTRSKKKKGGLLSGFPLPEFALPGSLRDLPPAARIAAVAGVGLVIIVVLSWITDRGSDQVPVVRPADCSPAAVAAFTPGKAAEGLGLAKACQALGKLDDTVSLLSRLKESGSGEAALLLGELFDPLDPSQKTPTHLTPSVVTAVELYRQACAMHASGAGERLAALKQEAEQEENTTNDRILLDLIGAWPECR
jgi:hypothetical protein